MNRRAPARPKSSLVSIAGQNGRTRPLRFLLPSAGVTMVELLVALAVVGVLLGSLAAFTGSSLRYSSRVSSLANQTRLSADAESYVVDVLRSAKAAQSSFVILDGTDNSAVLTCTYAVVTNFDPVANEALLDDRRCVGVLSPVVDGDGSIINFDFVAFSIEPIRDLYSDVGMTGGWDGTNTLALLEYRVRSLCGATTSCSSPDEIPEQDLVLEDGVGVVLTGLSPVDGSAASRPVDFIDFDGDALLRLRLVTRAGTSDGGVFVVDRDPVPLFVARRR